jgi:hypothetical protein
MPDEETLEQRLALLPADDHPWWTPERRDAFRRITDGSHEESPRGVDAVVNDFVTLGICEPLEVERVEHGGRRAFRARKETAYRFIPYDELQHSMATARRTE